MSGQDGPVKRAVDQDRRNNEWATDQPIQRARCAARRHLEYMGVNHGGADITVAQQLLHSADVGSGLQQVRGKR